MKPGKTIELLRTLPFLALIVLAGCATQTRLYGWGNYQQQLYFQLKGESQPEARIAALESNMNRIKAEGRAVPPGYHANLAMLYGDVGRLDKAMEHLDTEKKLFPESVPFMDYLLARLRQ